MNAQDWSLSGNNAPTSNTLGTLNNSPLNIYAGGQQRITLTTDGKLGYGITSPNYQIHLHAEDAALNAPNGHGDEVYGSIGTQSAIQITNQESGSGPNDGLLIGMTGSTCFMRTTDKLRMNIQNNAAYMSLNGAGRIDFYGASSGTDARVNLFAHNSKGLQILGNSGTQYGMRIKTSNGNMNAFEIHKSNATEMVIKGDGRIGLGTDTPDSNYLLDAAGKIRACEVKVANPGWCDYVFAPDYELMSLHDIEKFIQTNRHLPDVPSEAEVEEEGINLAEMNAVLLKKIEEMTLHMIAMEKRISELETK